MTDAERIATLRAALEAAKRQHVGGDKWHACPKTGNTWMFPDSRRCDCGADEHNAAIDIALAATAQPGEKIDTAIPQQRKAT